MMTAMVTVVMKMLKMGGAAATQQRGNNVGDSGNNGGGGGSGSGSGGGGGGSGSEDNDNNEGDSGQLSYHKEGRRRLMRRIFYSYVNLVHNQGFLPYAEKPPRTI